ncbi:hypothetical protein H1C71_021151 [Ictidomys tridecemlineatus]|nr:hypothetical protein H1C71_021151 [Ictidomys tridecemlineatus]
MQGQDGPASRNPVACRRSQFCCPPALGLAKILCPTSSPRAPERRRGTSLDGELVAGRCGPQSLGGRGPGRQRGTEAGGGPLGLAETSWSAWPWPGDRPAGGLPGAGPQRCLSREPLPHGLLSREEAQGPGTKPPLS